MDRKICLKCGYERKDTDNHVPETDCPSCGAVYAKVEAAFLRAAKERKHLEQADAKNSPIEEDTPGAELDSNKENQQANVPNDRQIVAQSEPQNRRGSVMKFVGVVLISLGIVWSVYAYNIVTTVETGGERISLGPSFSSNGSIFGEDYTYIPKRSIHNIGLMEERRLHMMLAGLTTICGVVIFGFGVVVSPQTSGTYRTCPHCAERINRGAKVCRYCHRDLPEVPEETHIEGAQRKPTFVWRKPDMGRRNAHPRSTGEKV